MGFLLSFIAGFAPMLLFAWFIYWLDRYEKEPRLLLGAIFLWGAIIAAGGAFLLNTILGMEIYLFTGSEAATNFTTGSIIAPFIEESLKGVAVLFVFLLFRMEFDSYIDGIVYAGIVALGFAATENVFYIYSMGYLENGLKGLLFLVFVRVLLVGWQHPFYTAFTGIGFAAARLSRSLPVKFLAPAAGLFTAMIAHGTHNTLGDLLTGPEGMAFGTFWDWTGWIFMFLFILWSISRDRQLIIQYLKEEADLGLITPDQYKTACSAWAQSLAGFGALQQGRYRDTRRFYQVCAELSHKKDQRDRLGEEGKTAVVIEVLRHELAGLAKVAYS
jgi:RsiW-degrading membrane proteinase PrsW (M82 family)